MTNEPQSRLDPSGESVSVNPAEPELASALQQVVEGLSNSDNHFTVSSNYYDHLTPGREGERWHIAQIWFNADTASNLELTHQGLACDVRLNQSNLNQISRILLPYSQIWNVQSINAEHLDIYRRLDKLNFKRPKSGD